MLSGTTATAAAAAGPVDDDDEPPPDDSLASSTSLGSHMPLKLQPNFVDAVTGVDSGGLQNTDQALGKLFEYSGNGADRLHA